MIRLAVIFLVALATFALIKMMVTRKQLTSRQFGFVYVAALSGILLVYLGVTGRLHWLFTILGIVLPFLVRGLPFILRFLDLRSLANRVRNMTHGGRQSSGQKSTVNTRFLAMELDHDTGDMDGKVLEGPHSGEHLSNLNLAQLFEVLDQVREDADSENVLRAYLDRAHPEWQEEASAGAGPAVSDGELTVTQAYEILGVAQGSDREAIRDAHRRLMQRVHPDRGGSDYLAARINEAKSVLLAHLDN